MWTCQYCQRQGRRGIHGKMLTIQATDLISYKSLTVFLAFSLFSQYYSAHAAYCQSKLAQLLFSSHLHQELQSGGSPLSSCAVDPGMVDTALYRHLWTPLCLAQGAIARLLFRVKHCPDFHLLHLHRGQV